MSRREEAEAYNRILMAQKRRYGVSIRDIVLGIVAFIVIIGGTLWISDVASSFAAPIIFIIGAIYLLLFLVAFFDYILGFGLFTENKVVFSAVLILVTVVIAIIFVLISGRVFENAENAENYGLFYTIYLISTSVLISYFIITATATRQGREEMIKKLSEIRTEVEKLPITALGSKSAVERSIKWLQFQQRDDGIWGKENPLYETSEVLRTFTQTEHGINFSWKRIVGGQEEVRTVEQTYYLVMEALDTANIEPNYEMLAPVLAIAEINPKFVNLNQEAFIEFKDDLSILSEWEFVKSLENYAEGTSLITDIPIIFPMSQIFYHAQNYEIAQHAADVFSSTFDILIRRSQTRFALQTNEKEISNYLLGKMYNSLVLMLRGKKSAGGESVFSEFGLEDEISQTSHKFPEEPSTGIELPDVPAIDSMEDEQDLPDIPGDDFDLPLPDMGETSEQTSVPKIRIDVSMAQIRNFLRSRQSIDGSWSGKIRDTAECLLAVLDQESPETEFVKLAVHYLLALQEKNGSWQDDIVLTSHVTRSLQRVNQAMGLGGF